jgi:propanol-preferring alcohol dehydrogenase
MRAMVLERPKTPLVPRDLPTPRPEKGEVLVQVAACGVCRTDLHLVDGELPNARSPIVPGHEIVGHVKALGAGVTGLKVGDRVGVPWLGHTCQRCWFCRHGMENLCDHPGFTGYTRDGGYATHVVADARFTFALPAEGDDVADAPLLCAGLIGWRSLGKVGDAERLGLYGFGAAAHIVAQVAISQGRSVYAFTKAGDDASARFARDLGAVWAGPADAAPPEPLDAAIIYAPVGDLVPKALAAVRKGGRVVCAGIHMSDIPSFRYALLWEERELISVANLTRQDGLDFFPVAAKAKVSVRTRTYPLAAANDALDDLRHGRFQGAAVLAPDR